MLRRAFPVVCLGLSAALSFAPAACSGDAESSQGAGGKGANANGGQTTAGKANAGGSKGGADSVAGSATGGNAGVGTPNDAGAAGVALGGAGTSSIGGAAEAGSPDPGAGGAVGDCEAVIASHALASGIHVTACTPIDYATNPPSSGQHYPVWADFGVYDFPLPRGFWMHNEEHGAVVVTYNCAQGCAADLAAAKAWLAQLAPDALCPSGPPRIILVPDPLLDVPWAASAWGYTLRANCFDAAAFSTFYVAHAGGALAPEAAICSAGADFRMDGVDTCGAK
jgi:hypothetical protein